MKDVEGIIEEIIKMDKNTEYNEDKSIILELLQDLKQANKRMFIFAMVVVGLWFSTIALFVWYELQFDTEITTTTETFYELDNANDGDNITNYNNQGGVINGKEQDKNEDNQKDQNNQKQEKE